MPWRARANGLYGWHEQSGAKSSAKKPESEDSDCDFNDHDIIWAQMREWENETSEKLEITCNKLHIVGVARYEGFVYPRNHPTT